MDNYTAFTVCNVAYLHKALVLAESYFGETGKFLKIYIIDTKREIEILNDNQEIIWIEDINVPGINQLAFKYDITELSTSLKPYIAKQNLQNYEIVLFFDPDICIYSSIKPILKDLENSSILLTPHYTNPEPNDWPNSDIGMMRFGSFNLGFFGVRETQQAENFK